MEKISEKEIDCGSTLFLLSVPIEVCGQHQTPTLTTNSYLNVSALKQDICYSENILITISKQDVFTEFCNLASHIRSKVTTNWTNAFFNYNNYDDKADKEKRKS